METTKEIQQETEDAILMDSMRKTLSNMIERQKEDSEKLSKWIRELRGKYSIPDDFETKVTALINELGRGEDKSPIATRGWDLIRFWRIINVRKAKNEQKKLTDIKSLLSQNAEIELTTMKGRFSKISVRRKTTTRQIDSPVIIGWFLQAIEDSKYRDRFFDNSVGEDSRMIFSKGEIFDFLCTTLKSVVEDFGAGSKENIGAVKNIVTKLKPLYRYIRSIGVPDADNKLIQLLELENILCSDDFVSYIEKQRKVTNK